MCWRKCTLCLRKSKQCCVARSQNSNSSVVQATLSSECLVTSPDSTTQDPVWPWTSHVTAHASISTMAKQGYTVPEDSEITQVACRHMASAQEAAVTALQRELGTSVEETECSPECFELHWTDHRVPLEALEQRNYQVQPGIMQVNLTPALQRTQRYRWRFTKRSHWWGKGLRIRLVEAERDKKTTMGDSGGRNERMLLA